MNVICHYRNDPARELLDPVLEPGSRRFVFRIYSGDILDPLNGNWFKRPYPTRIWRTSTDRAVLPFLAFRWPLLGRACYIGFKLYSADGNEYPEYREWMPLADTGAGSRAVCLSFRPFARLE